MKRTVPLRAKTGLKRMGRLRRGKPNARKLDRGKILFPRASIRKLREEVYARSGGRCDLCGCAMSARAWECHHRKKRSQGGRDDLVNLLALHPDCHHNQVHGRPGWAYEYGFLVRRDADPAQQPVFRHRTRWQLPGETQWHGVSSPAVGAT